MRSRLDSAAFKRQAINEGFAYPLTHQAELLLGEVYAATLPEAPVRATRESGRGTGPGTRRSPRHRAATTAFGLRRAGPSTARQTLKGYRPTDRSPAGHAAEGRALAVRPPGAGGLT